MMLVKYEPMAKLVNSQEPLNIEITKAGLYYVLIQQQNDASSTLLVPVWAFYGYRSWDWIEEQGIKYGLYEQPILMINAIDGSIAKMMIFSTTPTDADATSPIVFVITVIRRKERLTMPSCRAMGSPSFRIVAALERSDRMSLRLNSNANPRFFRKRMESTRLTA